MVKNKKWFIIFIFIIGIIGFVYFENNIIVVTDIKYTSEKIPDSFNNFKILQISDFHNKEFRDNQKYLVDKTKDIKPDIIVITGDLIDSRRTNVDIAMEYVEKAAKIAPVYYVTGNHEQRCPAEYEELIKRLKEQGVSIMDDKCESITRGNDKISIVGMQDTTFFYDGINNYESKTIEEKLHKLSEKSKEYGDFRIMLIHRPELINMYKNEKIDLVFCGHAHGGQVRLPFIGPLVAPQQGIFPKYTSGMYTEDNTSMVVSRGLGNSIIPLRIFNRPELVVVTLEK